MLLEIVGNAEEKAVMLIETVGNPECEVVALLKFRISEASIVR